MLNRDNEIGMLLKLSRISLKIQSKEMAERIGVSSATIQNVERLENGDLPAVLKYLLALRQEGISINDILDELKEVQYEK